MVGLGPALAKVILWWWWCRVWQQAAGTLLTELRKQQCGACARACSFLPNSMGHAWPVVAPPLIKVKP